MSMRLQVVLDEQEMAEIRAIAEREGLTVSEWVRQTLRSRRQLAAQGEPARKFAAVRAGARHDFPTGEIEDMLAEIERGHTW